MTVDLVTKSDYIALARELLKRTPLEPTVVHAEVLTSNVLALWVGRNSLAHELVACQLLQEFWPYDWLPVNLSIYFLPGGLRGRRGLDDLSP